MKNAKVTAVPQDRPFQQFQEEQDLLVLLLFQQYLPREFPQILETVKQAEFQRANPFPHKSHMALTLSSKF
jgi:hypothetical protein